MADNSAQPPVLFDVMAGQGRILLNRPEKHNALNLAMVEAMDEKLREWAADPAVEEVMIASVPGAGFCAGGDVRAAYDAKQAGDWAYLERFFRRQYTLDWRIATHPKPILAVMNGLVMGGGAGLAMNCSHRIVTEHARFAMPECRIGLFPDVGAGFFLNRIPGEMGLFLGLTGINVEAPGMLAMGLATHVVPGGAIGGLRLANLKERQATGAGESGLMKRREAINAIFSLPSLEEILTILVTRQDTTAVKAGKALAAASPLSAALAFRHLRNARGRSLAEVLAADFRLIWHCLAGEEFFAGIRAILIERSNKPDWQWKQLEDVPAVEIERHFSPLLGIPEWSPPA